MNKYLVMVNPNFVGEMTFKIYVDGSPIDVTMRNGQKMDLLQAFKLKDIEASKELRRLLDIRDLILL